MMAEPALDWPMLAMTKYAEPFVSEKEPDFTPDIVAELERLWTTTDFKASGIATLLNKKFGVQFSTSKVTHYANRHGFIKASAAKEKLDGCR